MRKVITSAMLLVLTACGDAPRRESAPAVSSEVQTLRAVDPIDLAELRSGPATEDDTPIPATAPPKAKSTVIISHRGVDGTTTKTKVVVPEVVIDTRIWPRAEPNEDIYAPLDEASPPVLDHPPSGLALAPRRGAEPIPNPDRVLPGPSFSTGALGVGAAGLGLAAFGVAASQDNPSQGALIFSGVTFGIGVTALAVGGIVYLIEADEGEPTRVSISLGSLLVDGSF